MMAIHNDMDDVTAHRPASPYGIQKLDNEYLARMFYTDHGLRTTCLRYFNVYGPRQDPNSAYAAAISNELTKLEPQMNTDERRCSYNNFINIFQPEPPTRIHIHPPRPGEACT